MHISYNAVVLLVKSNGRKEVLLTGTYAEFNSMVILNCLCTYVKFLCFAEVLVFKEIDKGALDITCIVCC